MVNQYMRQELELENGGLWKGSEEELGVADKMIHHLVVWPSFQSRNCSLCCAGLPASWRRSPALTITINTSSAHSHPSPRSPPALISDPIATIMIIAIVLVTIITMSSVVSIFTPILRSRWPLALASLAPSGDPSDTSSTWA